jgi:Tol biopolymer transport system component
MQRRFAAIAIFTGLFVAAASAHSVLADGMRPIGGFDVPDGPIVNLAWSPDGTHLAYCGTDGCHTVEVANGKITASMPGTGGPIAGDGQGVIGFSPDGNTLILPALRNDNNHFLTFWNTKTGAQTGSIGLLPGQRGDGSAAIASMAANGRSFAALSNGGGAQPVLIYSLPDLKQRQAIHPGPNDLTIAIAMSPDGRAIAMSRNNNAIVAYDIATGRLAGQVTYQTDLNVEPISGLSYSPDGKYLAAGFSNGGKVQVPGPGNTMLTVPNPWPTSPIYIWRLDHGVPYGGPSKLCGAQPQGVLNLLWTKDSHAVIFTDGYGSTKLCPVTGAPPTIIRQKDDDSGEVPALSPTGDRLAIGADAHIDIFALPNAAAKEN